MMLAVAVEKNNESYMMDVQTVFLNAGKEGKIGTITYVKSLYGGRGRAP